MSSPPGGPAPHPGDRPGPPPGAGYPPPPGPGPYGGPYPGPYPGPYGRPYPPLPGPLAEPGERVLQHLLDLLVTQGPTIVLFVIGIALANVGAFRENLPLVIVGVAVYVVALLGGLALGLVMQVFDAARHGGRTWGMRRRGLRVVKLDGSPVTTGDLALRWLLLIVIDGGLIALILVLATERRQRLGDMAAKTVVIDERLVGRSGEEAGAPPAW